VTGTRLGIAGLGLIGGSIALRARSLGAYVSGFDCDPAAVDAALAAGAIDERAAGLEELAGQCTVLALALPIPATIDALRNPALARPELVFDVASVKAPIAAAGSRLPRFVPSHPLAGRESGGFGAADATLFAGRRWVLAAESDPALRERLAAFVTALGAQPLTLASADHDRLVALTSHLPQLLSVVLGARLAAAGADDPRAYSVCGPGMDSMLRLARSPVTMWSEITAANAGPVAEELRITARALEALADGLAAGTPDLLAAPFAAARTLPQSVSTR
jgi:prephenate dehydrogenase